MGQFLPEGMPEQAKVQIATAEPVTSGDDVALMQKVFAAAMKNPSLIPADFMAYLVDYMQTTRLNIPIGQVSGFTRFTPQVLHGAFSPTSFSNTTPGDPPNGAFTLTPLPSGRYFFIYGANLHVPAGGHGNTITMNLHYPPSSVFDSAPLLQHTWDGATVLKSDVSIGAVGLALFDLIQASNDISLYVGLANAVPPADAGQIGNRFIAAFRYANL
jgi:hypothetical protein